MAAKYELNDASVVVVIGSGAGGGTLANELCQKGVKVVCLEAGNHLTLEDFVNDEFAMWGKLTGRIRAQVSRSGSSRPWAAPRTIGRACPSVSRTTS